MAPEPFDQLDPGAADHAALAAALSELEDEGQVGVATGVLAWRHCLSVAQARALLTDLAHERGVSVTRMADLLQPSDS